MIQNSAAALKARAIEALPANENIIWCAQPTIKLFRPADIIQLPFMIIWTSIAVFSMCTVISIKAPIIPFAILPAIFVLIGSYATWGRLLHHYLVFKNCIYVISDQKAYIISNFPAQKKVSSAVISPATPVIALQNQNGTTDLIFEEIADYKLAQWQSNPFFMLTNKPFAFRAIASTEPVIEYLRSATKLTERGVTAFGMALTAPMTVISSAPSLVPPAVATKTSRSSLAPSSVANKTNQFSLLPDEQILWQGKPERNFRLRKTDLLGFFLILIFAAVLSSVLTFVFKIAAVHISGWVIFALTFVGLFILSAISESTLKNSTKYAITNKRILSLWKPVSVVKQSSVDFAQISSITCSAKGDDTGTIVFNMKDHPLVRIFGAEGILCDPLITQRAEPFLLDIPKTRSVLRLIEKNRQSAIIENQQIAVGENSPAAVPDLALRKPSAARDLPANLSTQIMWLTQTSGAVFFAAFIALIVGISHMCSYGFQQIHSLLTGAPPCLGPPQFFFLIPLLFVCAAPSAIIWHVLKSRMQIRILRTGVAARGTYLIENAVAYANGKPWLIKRTYEFSDQTGVKRTAYSLVSTKNAIKQNVTILYDQSKPSDNVVLDDLPGEPKLDDSGKLR